MQEILPSIETTWSHFSKEFGHKMTTINIDQDDFSSYMNSVLESDYIVVSAFNTQVSNTLIKIRNNLSIDSPFLIYLHGMSSLLCWPFHHYGLSQILTTSDTFLSSAKKDLDLFNLTYKNSSSKILPFGLKKKIAKSITKNETDISHFAYVGRLSSQKNLHGLIFCFYLYKKMNPKKEFHLHIFGSEDNLGSPNMGVSDDSYAAYLQKLTKDLKLNGHVTFHGFQPREKLYSKIIPQEYCFISLSIHCDENFGMALLSSLSQGAAAISTNWGGHLDFDESFEKQLSCVDVVSSDFGPTINFSQAVSLIESYGLKGKTYKSSLPDRYDLNKQMPLVACIMNEVKGEGSPLKISSLSKEILESRKKLNNSENGMKLFNDYTDKIANTLFEAYGMIEGQKEVTSQNSDSTILPWVTVTEELILINNPHTGKFTRKRDQTLQRTKMVKDIFDQEINLSQEESDYLSLQRLLLP